MRVFIVCLLVAAASAHVCQNCAAGSTGNKCQKATNKKCYNYVGNPDKKICPPNTSDCRDLCDDCVNFSYGPCQAADGVCSSYQVKNGKFCSPATQNCRPVFRCGDCAAGSKGHVCQSPKSKKCYNYKFGETCPPKTVACGELCHGCVNFSSGPCIAADNVCHAYQVEATKTCPPATTSCYTPETTDTEPEGPAPTGCTGCFGSSAGPCKAADNVCSAYINPATQQCSPATVKC